MPQSNRTPARRSSRTSLAAIMLCGVAAAAVAAPGVSAAKTRRHHAAPSAAAAENAALREEVKTLAGKVDALEARLAAQEQGQQQAQATAQQVQQQAQAEIQTIPGAVQSEVKTQVKAAIPPVGWWGSTTISGRVYYDISDIQQRATGAFSGNPRASDGVNFDIKRFYLGVDHKFNNTFSANVTTDFQYNSTLGATELYIKKAYLQAKMSDALIVRLGATDLPWVPFMEDQYGYRFVENVMIDRDKFGTSSDWGVHALGNLAGGMIQYDVAAVNGAGYKAPGTGNGSVRSQGIDLEGRVNANVQDFTVAVGGYTGKLGKDIDGGSPTFHRANRFDVAAIWHPKQFRIGGEYFYASNWTAVTSATSDSAEGFSVFGNYNITPKVSVFGRYDWVKPRRDTNPNLRDNYFNFGINYEPVKIVDFALVYKRDKIDNGTLATSNGTIGGGINGTYDEVGLWGQFRW